MSATIHHLPTANIAPLPRKANVGRLPKGVVRFSAYKRQAQHRRAAAALETFQFDATQAMRTLLEATRAGKSISAEDIIRQQRDAFYLAHLRGCPPKGAA